MAKKRGRPPGSKNKPKGEDNAETTADNGEGAEEATSQGDEKNPTQPTDDPTEVGEDKLEDFASREIGAGDSAAGLRFELVEDEDGDWHWMLFARNGRPVATNVEPYERRNDAERSIQRFATDVRAAQRNILVRLS